MTASGLADDWRALSVGSFAESAAPQTEFDAWRDQTYTLADSTESFTQFVPDVGAGTQSDASMALVGADQGRARYGYTGTGYAVAVLDTGIDYNHPDLSSAYLTGYDFVDDDNNPMDLHGHGTHVAGIIAGRGTNFPGVAPGARIISLRVLDANGSGNFGDVYDALQWVIDHRQQYNIVSINMSLGSGNYTANPYQYLEGKLQTLSDAGVFTAVASGNSFYTYGSQVGLGYPAISSLVVSVGAVWDANAGSVSWSSGARDNTTAIDRITSFTQRHQELDIVAPGAMITSTYLNRVYASMAGTSMAAPVVAGAAVLVRQALDATGQTSLANQTGILNLMRSTGVSVVDGDDEDDNVTNTGLTFKRLNVLAALDAVEAMAHPHATQSVGFYNSATSTFFLKNTNSQGLSDSVFNFGPGGAGWTPLVGDWDGNGTESVGFYYSATSQFFLKNDLSQGLSDLVFRYGPRNSNWVPVAGDWDGNGTTGVGFFDPSTGNWFLKNNLTNGLSDVTYSFGPSNTNWKPIVGDWDGDGTYTPGFYEPSTSKFYLKNSHGQGLSDLVFRYGPRDSNWVPLVGDWNADGISGLGFYDPGTSTFFLKNSLTNGLSDGSFSFGPAGAGWMPLVGAWRAAGAAGAAGAGGEILETSAVGARESLGAQGAWLAVRAMEPELSRIENTALDVAPVTPLGSAATGAIRQALSTIESSDHSLSRSVDSVVLRIDDTFADLEINLEELLERADGTDNARPQLSLFDAALLALERFDLELPSVSR